MPHNSVTVGSRPGAYTPFGLLRSSWQLATECHARPIRTVPSLYLRHVKHSIECLAIQTFYRMPRPSTECLTTQTLTPSCQRTALIQQPLPRSIYCLPRPSLIQCGSKSNLGHTMLLRKCALAAEQACGLWITIIYLIMR